jgi:NADH-quinone oxidoreductase subunit F
MPEFEPVLLKRIIRKADVSLDAYRADGGYRALSKTVNEMTPAQVIDAVKASGLRGRGGAGFPTGLKWTFLPKDHPGPIYMCINGDESEPCTFNNRILVEEDPHQVLEGIILSCYATRATTAYFYLR